MNHDLFEAEPLTLDVRMVADTAEFGAALARARIDAEQHAREAAAEAAHPRTREAEAVVADLCHLLAVTRDTVYGPNLLLACRGYVALHLAKYEKRDAYPALVFAAHAYLLRKKRWGEIETRAKTLYEAVTATRWSRLLLLAALARTLRTFPPRTDNQARYGRPNWATADECREAGLSQ